MRFNDSPQFRNFMIVQNKVTYKGILRFDGLKHKDIWDKSAIDIVDDNGLSIYLYNGCQIVDNGWRMINKV